MLTTIKQTAIGSVPVVGPEIVARTSSAPRNRGRVSLGSIAVIIALAMLANAFHLFGLRIPGLPGFGTTQSVSTPGVVVPHFVIDDTYAVMHETTQFSIDHYQCRQGMPDSCTEGTLSAAAIARVTEPLVAGRDYIVTTNFNAYATASKMGDVNVRIVIYTAPSIANPSTDVNLLTDSIKFMTNSSGLAWLAGTSVDQSELQREAQKQAVIYAQSDLLLWADARAQIIKKITADAVAWGKAFRYVVHPVVLFGDRRTGGN